MTYFGLYRIKKGSMKKENTKVFKPKKKKAGKKLSPALKKMALKYEAALQKCRKELNVWKRTTVDEEPNGRHAKEFYREVVLLAESEGFEPKKVIYAGKDETVELQPPPMLSGKSFEDSELPPDSPKGGAY